MSRRPRIGALVRPSDDRGGSPLGLDELTALATAAAATLRDSELGRRVMSSLWRAGAQQLRREALASLQSAASRKVASRPARPAPDVPAAREALRSLKQDFEDAGGVDGLRAMIADSIGGPAPRPAAARPQPAPAGLLVGKALSGSRVRGTARIAASADAAPAVGRGEVLVCRSLGPDFQAAADRAGAIVVESGSAASAAIRAARNRGVPVVLIADATALIPDAAEVTVNGSLGQVDLRTAQPRAGTGPTG